MQTDQTDHQEIAMRFGIMAMQIESLIPSGLPTEGILAHIGRFDHANLVRSLASQGFRLIELGGDLSLFLPQAFFPPAIERLAALKSELGLTYTLHLPLWSLETSTPLEPVRQGSVQAVTQILQAAQPLGPEIYVLHATGSLAAEFYRMHLAETARSLLLRQFQAAARESLEAILAETGIPSRQLAVETIEFPFDLTLELAEELDLSICFDTGHVLAGFSGPVDLFETLERSLPRLGEIHLHDAPALGILGQVGYGTDHRPLGAGELDLHRFLQRLESAGFDGPVVLELQVQEALASLEVIRSLNTDFRKYI